MPFLTKRDRAPSASRQAVRRLSLASMISLGGTDAAAVALSFTLFSTTGSTVWLAASLLVTFGLGALLAPVAGALADRLDRRRLIMAAEVGGAAAWLGLVLAPDPTAMLALSALATTAGTLAGPAAAAAIPSVAGDKDLNWAIGLVAMGTNVGRTAGRLGGGMLVAFAGADVVFGLNALSFIASALLVLSVRRPFQARVTAVEQEDAPSFGMRDLLSNRTLRLVLMSGCLATLATAFSQVAETPLAFELGAGAAGLGALTAAWTIGMVAGSWAAARKLTEGSEALGLLAGRVLMGMGLGLVSFAPGIAAAVALYAVGGFAGAFLLVASSSLVQRSTVDAVRGRANALVEGAKTATAAVGTLGAGVAGTMIEPRVLYALVGIGVLVSALPAWSLVRSAPARGAGLPAPAPAAA